MRTKSIVVLAAVLLLVASVAPAVAADGSLAVSVDQEDDGSATATVTQNGSAVENASVVVNATGDAETNETAGNATYVGEGTYTTDENGTADLPAPEENVTIEVLAEYGNETASTTADLTVAATNGTNETAANESFGQRVSAYVHSLLNGTEEQHRLGRLIAAWVTANNPGNAPDHAGPPDDAGPPDHAGPSASATDGDDVEQTGVNVTASGPPDPPGKSGERDNGHGPPEDRGSNGKAKGHGT